MCGCPRTAGDGKMLGQVRGPDSSGVRHVSAQQAASTPWPSATSGGSCTRQTSRARAQRGLKRQPGGMAKAERHGALDRAQPVLARLQRRHRAQQAARVGMLRLGEQPAHRRMLDHLAGVHHHDIVHQVGDHAQVVGDQDDRGAELLLQAAQQVEDLRLDRDVERGGRFVGDQQLGIARQRHADHRALPHAAGQLVRIGAGARVPDRGCRPARSISIARCQAAARDVAAMQAHRLGDLLAHGEHRVQRGHRILVDHRDVAAAQRAQARGVHRHDVLAVEQDAAADDARRRARDQPHQRQRGHGLAAARIRRRCPGSCPLAARS